MTQPAKDNGPATEGQLEFKFFILRKRVVRRLKQGSLLEIVLALKGRILSEEILQSLEGQSCVPTRKLKDNHVYTNLQSQTYKNASLKG